jgi:hypothetical protein
MGDGGSCPPHSLTAEPFARVARPRRPPWTLARAAFAAKKPHLVFFSSYWSAWPSVPAFQPISVQSKFAKWVGAYLVAANVALPGYYGGGIYKPDGTAMATTTSSTPSVIYATIPP